MSPGKSLCTMFLLKSILYIIKLILSSSSVFIFLKTQHNLSIRAKQTDSKTEKNEILHCAEESTDCRFNVSCTLIRIYLGCLYLKCVLGLFLLHLLNF